jgi:integrase
MPKHIALMPLRQIDRLPPGLHAVSPCLYAAVNGKGGRSWIYRYRDAGKTREMGLGSMADIDRDQAVDRVKKLRDGLLQQIDPLAAKRSKTLDRLLAVTFEQAARAYHRDNAAGWSASHKAAWLRNLERDAFPILGGLRVDRIEVEHVLAVIRDMWTTKHESASRLRGQIETVLDAATALKQRSGPNPAQWKGNLKSILPDPKRVKVKRQLDSMPYADVPAFVAQLGDSDPAMVLRFEILTGARPSEAREAVWPEIDLEARVWRIPAARMKARVEHVVPLSAPALAILAALPRNRGDNLFDSSRDAVAALVPPGATAHGFRSSFSTWAGESTNFARDIVERCIAHSTGTKVEQSYRRGEEIERKRHVFDAWARFVTEPESPANSVIDLRRRTM